MGSFRFRVRRRQAARAALWLVTGTALQACLGTPAEPEAKQKAATERLQFALPAEFVALELRGEGSETLRAPPGAVARALPGRVEVEAGGDFALEVELEPQQPELPSAVDGARPVARESDLVVFESAGSYSFVTLRELVPEWDESDRRRVTCSSAGAIRKGPATELRRFPRTAVERMVAACRSLALPRLE